MNGAVRPASRGELCLLPAIEAASDTLLQDVPGTQPGAVDRLPPPTSEEALHTALQVLVAGRPPQGFARIEEVGTDAHLEQLSVDPRHAGRGVGRALVEAALAWAREQGYPGMTLCTFADVPFNAPFYRSCGFVVIDPEGELARVRENERRLGLDSLGARVAMRKSFEQGSTTTRRPLGNT